MRNISFRNYIFLKPSFCGPKGGSKTKNTISFCTYFVNFQVVNLVRQATSFQLPQNSPLFPMPTLYGQYDGIAEKDLFCKFCNNYGRLIIQNGQNGKLRYRHPELAVFPRNENGCPCIERWI